MAIARDASTSKDLAVSPNTGSHTCAASSFLVVGTYGGVAFASGVTYNGVAMTRVADVTSGAGEYNLTLWYLTAPTAGANTISVSVASGSVGYWAESYTGVPGGAGVSTTNTSSGTGLTTTLAGIDNVNDWVVGIFSSSANTLSPSTGTNFIFTQLHNTDLGDSNGVVGATTYSMSTTSASGTFAACLLDLKVSAPAVAAFSSPLLLMGVG